MIQILMRLFSRHLIINPSVTLRALVLLAAVLAYGASGFLYFELPGNPDLTWGDSLWYTLVTLTTVGYGDFFPKTMGGRFLVGVPLMLIGIGLLGFILSVVASALITAKSKELKGMSCFNFSRHVVLVNFPGIAKLLRLLDEIANDPAIGRDAQIVLIDRDLEELPPELLARKLHYVRGDPARDATLLRAAINTASHAIVFSGKDVAADAINVTIALAIEARAPQVKTVIECLDPGTEELLRKAGCDHVVCSSRFEALYVSQELLNPGMQDILGDLLSNDGGQQFYLTPIEANADARFGDLVKAASSAGHVVMGLRRQNANHLNLSSDFPLAAGDLALTIGARRQVSFRAG
ncbi:MAG: Ion transport 2 domain protein [Proteobacteria bacterium]|nr:Ion transport 2 domain protein [Pseudomonadota bacterium]